MATDPQPEKADCPRYTVRPGAEIVADPMLTWDQIGSEPTKPNPQDSRGTERAGNGGWRTTLAPDEQATRANWPEPMSEDAFYGLAGDFVRLVLQDTEADAHALLLAFLVGFGCMVGRGPFYQVEATRHSVNLFSVIVGDTLDCTPKLRHARRQKMGDTSAPFCFR